MRSVYTEIDSHKIFGMVGRCGSGPNTRWSDWSFLGRKNRDSIQKEYMHQLNQYCSHYIDLEKNILKNGFIDPIIVSYPYPRQKLNTKYLPPELRDKHLFVLDSFWGASRLWVAQKHNLAIPCIVNDETDSVTGRILKDTNDIKAIFTKKPDHIYFKNEAIHVKYNNNNFIGSHIKNKNIKSNDLRKYRELVCGELLSKYGYENPFTAKKNINFYCVYKKPVLSNVRGVKSYDLKYIQKLHEGIIKHTPNTYNIKFSCLSDQENCTTPLKYNWPGWWSKMELFRPDITEDILYMDLDTVIYDNLVDILDICTTNPFPIMSNNFIKKLQLKGGLQSSVMWLPAKYRGIIWAKWIRNPDKIMEKYNVYGDQKFITDIYSPIVLKFDELKPGCVVSYKKHCKGSVPDGAKIICYHGNPRPHQTNWAYHS